MDIVPYHFCGHMAIPCLNRPFFKQRRIFLFFGEEVAAPSTSSPNPPLYKVERVFII